MSNIDSLRIAEGRIFFESRTSIPEGISLNPKDKVYLNSGPYICKSMLGEGGFGHVYHIISESTDESYALKILDLSRKDPKDFDNYKKRFQQGFEIGRLKSNNLVTNFFHGELKGNPYIVMEYCGFGSLRSMIGNTLERAFFDRVCKSIINGLKALHENGIVHRDLKPENILLDDSKESKLSDYDISILVDRRQTTTNWLGHLQQVWGTLPYAPPEQLDVSKGIKSLTFAADIFSFGITAYELATKGCLPYGSIEEVNVDPEKYYEKIRKGKFTPITTFNVKIDPYWVSIIHKCISPNVADRFANATELYRALPNSFIAKPYSPEPLNGIWQLHILNGVERGKVFNLNALLSLKSDNCLTLGFGEDKSDLTNDIGIQEYYSRFISRKHATFIFEEGSWYLKDGQMSETSLTEWKQSKNGTFVNSYQLEENEKFLLKDGDLIQIGGETSLQLKLY